MYYACEDIFGVDDKDRCKQIGITYDECCQECNLKNQCNSHCDYAHHYGCICKYEKIEGDK